MKAFSILTILALSSHLVSSRALPADIETRNPHPNPDAHKFHVRKLEKSTAAPATLPAAIGAGNNTTIANPKKAGKKPKAAKPAAAAGGGANADISSIIEEVTGLKLGNLGLKA